MNIFMYNFISIFNLNAIYRKVFSLNEDILRGLKSNIKKTVHEEDSLIKFLNIS